MTPQCPKRLPGDEYTSESQLPGGENTGESQLTDDEYTGESTSLCTLNKHKNRLTKKLSNE